MSRRANRREFLARVAGATAGVVAALRGAVLRAQNPGFPPVPTWRTELRELAPNVFAYIQGGGPGIPNFSISNAGLIAGEDHLLAIDALAAPFHARAFISAAHNATGGKPFRRLINTHHHADHTAANQFFMPAEIVGHEYCRQEVLKTIPATPPLWQKRDGWADGTEERKVFAPTTTFSTGSMTYHYGSTVVELISVAPAHTYGDVMVYLPQHKILFAGDVAFHYVAPFAQNAHVTKWIETVDRIVETMAVDVVVPGHGPIGGKRELADMGEYFKLLKREARKRFDVRMSAGQAAADIQMGRFDNWIGPERIAMDTVRLYAEFKGTLVPDMDVDGTRQATDEYTAIKARVR